MAIQTLNNGEAGVVVRGKINSNFSEHAASVASLNERIQSNTFSASAATEVAIVAAASLAIAAGGGTVFLPPGDIALTAPLPVSSYLRYEGVRPKMTLGSIPDNPWTFSGGTILIGNGTFPAFAGNNTDQGSPLVGAAYSNAGLIGFGASNIGFDNFSNAVAVGAVNSIGVLYGDFSWLFARKCTGWAFDFTNTMHSPIHDIYACIANGDLGHGIRMRSAQPSGTLMSGNTTADRLYVYQGTLTGRGIVLEAEDGAILNQVRAERIQCNRFGGAGVAQAATMSNGSTSIAVPDATKYPVGMPVTFSATANGFTANVAYFVLTNSGSAITVGTNRVSAAVSATGSTAVNILSNGMPNVELVAATVGGISNARVLHIDAEGFSAAQVYLQNIAACEVDIAEVNKVNSTNNLVMRTVSRSHISCGSELVADIDAGCYSSSFRGAVLTRRQRTSPGIQFENTQDRMVLNLFSDSGSNPDFATLSLAGGGVIQMSRAVAGKVGSAVGGAVTLDAGRAGIVPVSGAGPHTLTLPAITDATKQSSWVGVPFEIVNLSSVIVTVNTNGVQTLNGQAGVFSTTVAAGASKRFVALNTSTWAVFG